MHLSLYISLQSPAIFRVSLLLFAALFMSGCATRAIQTTEAPTPINCTAWLADLDSAIQEQALNVAGTQRINGLPFMRVDRFAASFDLNELNKQERAAWQDYVFKLGLRDFWAEASFVSARSETEDFIDCVYEQYIRWSSETGWQSIENAPEFSSNYQTLNRVLGLYPLTTIPMKAAINGYRTDMTQRMQSSTSFEDVTNYLAPNSVQPEGWRNSAIGVPMMIASEWQALFDRHAPSLQIAFETQDDLIGRVEWQTNQAVVNTDAPLFYTYPSYTRFQNETLIHLNYAFWFPARTAQKPGDIYAGEFDGITWRVTLNQLGEVQWFDSIHTCGCYHKIYTPNSQWRLSDSIEGERPIVVSVDSALRLEKPLLRITAAEHYIIAVEPQPNNWTGEKVALAPYHELVSLADGDRSMPFFDRRGLVAESRRLERFLLWPQGIISAGAMRNRGTHAIAFIGERHFDDAFLFEALLSPAATQVSSKAADDTDDTDRQ